jgi:pimeloyl-ACP methyl ester carboxylesterase
MDMGSRRREQPAWSIDWLLVSLGLLCCAGGGCTSAPRPGSVDAFPVQPCSTASFEPSGWVSPQKADLGYTVVLPGILGSQPLDHGIVQGLVNARAPCAIDLYDWTAGGLMMLYNLRGLDRNRHEARTIARKIMAYQDCYPGRPVNLIGYSGGAAMAVFALEALPPERKVTSAILLAPTLAPEYDLRTAASRTEQGICSFYSPLDVPLLMAMTFVLGTSEGRHTFAAGALGFETHPKDKSDPLDSSATPVVQQRYTLDMLSLGHPGGHFGWANPAFVAQWVAPLIRSPATGDSTAGAEPKPGLYR